MLVRTLLHLITFWLLVLLLPLILSLLILLSSTIGRSLVSPQGSVLRLKRLKPSLKLTVFVFEALNRALEVAVALMIRNLGSGKEGFALGASQADRIALVEPVRA